jgi:hypothetical protein
MAVVGVLTDQHEQSAIAIPANSRQRGLYSAKGSPERHRRKFIARVASPAISLILLHNCSVALLCPATIYRAVLGIPSGDSKQATVRQNAYVLQHCLSKQTLCRRD